MAFRPWVYDEPSHPVVVESASTSIRDHEHQMTHPGTGQMPDIVLDEDDWFGDGSAFDSGEDLAAALMAFAGVAEPAAAGGAPVPSFEVAEYNPAQVAQVPRPQAPSEFQLAELPATARPESSGVRSGWGQRGGAQRNGWAIRNSVKMLKTTEDVMRRLREDAVEVSWRAAQVAYHASNH